jgi:NitT/TauT family transport system ATP-binding protein
MSLAVELREVGVRAGGHDLVRGLSLSVAAGEFACIIGPSGAGKSITLSVIAGLRGVDEGAVTVGGDPVERINPRVQLVFQHGELFPWLNVRQNVEFGLRARGVPRDVRRGEVEGYLRLVGLSDVADRRIHQLSGGMRQRVALARALIMNPHVLLLDEPFSALDAITRASLQVELLRLWQQTGVTVIFVTHNLREALLLADTVHLLAASPGRIEGSWRLEAPRAEREHHPSLRPLERELAQRLRVASPAELQNADEIA